MPVIDWTEDGRRTANWLKSHSPGQMDRLVPLDEFVEQSVKENSSAQAEEMDRLRRKASVDKAKLEHDLVDIRSEISELEKQSANTTSDRMQRLVLERKLGEAKNKLMAKEESIYFDAMRIDLACDEDIQNFLKREQLSAKLQRHFEIGVAPER